MRWLDLFSGIGAYALGLEQAGHEVIGFCENDAWARKVLKKHWPTKPISWCIKSLVAKLTESLVDSPVRISARQAKVPGYSTSNPPGKPLLVQDSGGNWLEPFAWYDQDSRCWRTWQQSLVEVWESFSETWPRSGMMRSGIAYRRNPLAPLTRETVSTPLLLTPRAQESGERQETFLARMGDRSANCHSSLTAQLRAVKLPTMGASEYKGASHKRFKGSQSFRGAKMSEGLRTSLQDPKYLNPCFAELIMGLPKDYTALGTPIHLVSSEN